MQPTSMDLFGKVQKERLDNLDQANQEIDKLRKHADKLQAELQGEYIALVLSSDTCVLLFLDMLDMFFHNIQPLLVSESVTFINDALIEPLGQWQSSVFVDDDYVVRLT